MITSDRLLSVIFGSAIFALGVAILYKTTLLAAVRRSLPSFLKNIST